jgi:hypothetical protein
MLLTATAVLPAIGIMNNIFIGNLEFNDFNLKDMKHDICSYGPDGYNMEVGFFRPSTGMWYYDYDHDGDTDRKSGPWGNPGDIPLAGGFDSEYADDVAVFRPSTQMWIFDLDQDGDTDYRVGPWGWEDDIPFTGLYHLVIDKYCIGVFRASEKKWFIDYDHDRNTDETSGPWGEPGDIPFAGDFNSDAHDDGVGIFRPSTKMWSYDHDHDGDTDERSGPWGESGDLPFVGDFDSDGKNDDVGIFRPSNSMWYYDYNHDGDTDETSGPWGKSGDLPFAGDFNFENHPPSAPIINGPSSGKVDTSLDFSFTSIDPDRGDIFYYIKWGDGDTVTSNALSSGTTYYKSHEWDEQMEFTIEVQAEDTSGAKSVWTYFQIQITKSKSYYMMNPIINRFLENHPCTFPLLKIILRL